MMTTASLSVRISVSHIPLHLLFRALLFHVLTRLFVSQDSVPTGPGLVDNASGSATLLEILLLLERHHPRFYTHNKLVFAWWGAEEVGLLGSRHYVRTLSEKEKCKIVANLNFDMLASPNGIPFVSTYWSLCLKFLVDSG